MLEIRKTLINTHSVAICRRDIHVSAITQKNTHIFNRKSRQDEPQQIETKWEI